MANVATLATLADSKASQKAGQASFFMPTGVILPFSGQSGVPTGWLLCDGTAYNQADYPELYALLGNLYNTQINPTTGAAWVAPSAGQFRVPDHRAVFLRGEGTPSVGDAVTTGGWQAQKTAKNGLSAASVSVTVSGLKNQMNGGTGNNSAGHSHTVGESGAHSHTYYDWSYCSQSYGNWGWRGSGAGEDTDNAPGSEGGRATDYGGYHDHTIGGDTGSHTHSWNFGTTATFSASGTVAAQTISGDNETRPSNKGVNYIIKV
jgi:microcystin-dependent protein